MHVKQRCPPYPTLLTRRKGGTNCHLDDLPPISDQRNEGFSSDGISALTACEAERRVGDRFPLADGASGRRLEPIPFPEHEPAIAALGWNLAQRSPLATKALPKVFQVALDLFFRFMDGGGYLLRRVRPRLQKGADLTPCGFRFLKFSNFGHYRGPWPETAGTALRIASRSGTGGIIPLFREPPSSPMPGYGSHSRHRRKTRTRA